MKKHLLNIFITSCLSAFIFSAKGQSVLLDAHSDAGGATTWQITTNHPNELIIIAANGYSSGLNTLSTAAGTIKVNGNNATYITRGEWMNSDTWVATIWAYAAPVAGTYTLTCTETGLQSPFYFNYASSVYDPGAPLALSNILIGGNDSNHGPTTITTSITTVKNNSWVYGTVIYNDNGGSGTLNWNGGLTELDHDYISNGVDCAQADSTIAVPGLQTVTVTDIGASSPWAAITLIAVQPPFTCNLSVAIDSLIQAGCNDSLWAVVTGGTKPYTFNWSPGGYTKDTIGHLCPNTYKVVVTDSNGCKDSATIVLTPSGINAINGANEQISLYPNPFVQSINVDAKQPVVVNMFNMLGENVGSWTLSAGHQSIDAQQYSSGIYMMQVKTLDGTMLLSKKIIKVSN